MLRSFPLGPVLALLVACASPTTPAPIDSPTPASSSRSRAKLSPERAAKVLGLEAAEAPKPAEPSDPGRANRDPSDDEVVGPPEVIPDCEARLTAAGVRFRAGSIPVTTTKRGSQCGAPQIIVYESGPTGIKWNAQPMVTCQLALGLARFEAILQEQAEDLLGSRVARIHQNGTYSCRKMARFKLVSEHSYANAMDIRAFELADRRLVSVKRDFGPLGAEPERPESQFLRTSARRAFHEYLFSVVLTPFWDKLHADHFHVDQARYRVGSVDRTPS